jgi:hypothetical protein
MSDELEAAFRVVLTHLRGTPAIPAPSITLPLAEWQKVQEELARLKVEVARLHSQNAQRQVNLMQTQAAAKAWQDRQAEIETTTAELLAGYRQGGQS